MDTGLTHPLSNSNPEIENSSLSWSGTLAGCASFLFYGGFTILQFSQPLRPVYPWFTTFDTVIFWSAVVLLCGISAFAWTKYFPRWSYPYISLLLLFTVVMCFLSPTGCLPLLITVALALLVTRSTRPLLHLFDQGLEDWTLFAFGAFGTLPVWMAAFYDLAEPSIAIPWSIVLTLFMTGVAIVYLRSPHFRQRSQVILAGIFLTVIALLVGPMPYLYKIGWEKNGWAEIGPMIFAGTLLLLILFFPVLLVKLVQHLWETNTGSG